MPIGTLITLVIGCILVLSLSRLLLELGKECRTCPYSGAAAGVATLSVLGAFTSMGLGVVAVFAAFANSISMGDLPNMLVATGMTAVSLGIGFSIAATALKDALLTARREARTDEAQKNSPQPEEVTA